MAKYIEVDCLREAFLTDLQNLQTIDEHTADLMLTELEEAPAADVAPVVHSKWIFNDEWWEFRCTNCQGAFGNVKKYNYCPHCGAKMDGGKKCG